MTAAFAPWSIRAVNLPEHTDNPVHTEAGGHEAGYAGAVVAGTTIYAYLTRPVAAAWGEGWVTGGGASVRFRRAVIADELVTLEPIVGEDDHVAVNALVGDAAAAVLNATLAHEPSGEPVGDRLEPLVVELSERWSGYAARAGECLPLYTDHDLLHPVVWPSLANRVFMAHLVDGPWVHTRSEIRHLGPARPGEIAVVEAFEIDRFDSRAGERAVVDVRVSIDGRPVAAIEHEAIVRLAG